MKRTPYLQSLMHSTLSMLSMEAMANGFDGAWERLIAEKLKKDVANDHSEAIEIVELCISSPGPKEKALYLKAAYLITSSKIQSDGPDDLQDIRFGL